MMRSQTTNILNLAAQFFPGSIALVLVTLAFFRLGVDLASTAFACLIAIRRVASRHGTSKEND